MVFGALLIALAAPVAFGQAVKVPDWQTAAGGTMSFEVASIRPTKEGEFTPPNFPLSSDDSYHPVGGNFSADFPLWVYIEFAYKLWLSPEQRKAMRSNLPKWVGTDAYEIHAKGPANATKDQMRLMMQSLLAEQFKLAAHFESQEVPVLAMSLINRGSWGRSLLRMSISAIMMRVLRGRARRRAMCFRRLARADHLWPRRGRIMKSSWVRVARRWQ